MADLATFTAGVEEALRDADRQPLWTPDDAEKYMAEYADRRRRFDELGTRLASTIIRPRLETLVGHFANASIEEEPARRYSGWFGYCEKFPVSAKIELSVEHDVRFEKIVIHSATYMMPVFFRFNEQDNLPLSLDNDSDEQVTNWVEERMLEFLDDYLRIAMGYGESNEDTATDPVCGMRISRSGAAAAADFGGHPYYFCSQACRAEFTRGPSKYVRVKTMW